MRRHCHYTLHLINYCYAFRINLGGYDCDYAGHHNSLKIMEHSTVPLQRGNNNAHDDDEGGIPGAHVVVDENNR